MDAIEKLADSITDAVTLEIMTDPYLISSCQHTFEKSSLDELLSVGSGNAVCPSCRNAFTLQDIAPNYSMRDVIASTVPLLEKMRNDAQLQQMDQKSENKTTVKEAEAKVEAKVEAKESPTAQHGVDVRITHDGTAHTLVEVIAPKGTTRVPTDLVLCIDNSGSMCSKVYRKGEDGKDVCDGLTIMDISKHAARVIATAAGPQDRISIVKFSTGAEVVLPPTIMDAKGQQAFESALSQIHPEGCTNLWAGLNASLDSLKNTYTGRNSAVCLLTDGVPTASYEPARGYTGALKRYMEKNPNFVFSLNTIGFGYSLDSALLDQLSSNANGSFLFVPDAGFVGTVFVNLFANIVCTFGTKMELAIESEADSKFIEGVVGVLQQQGFVANPISGGINVSMNNFAYGQNRHLVLPYMPVESVRVSFSDTKALDAKRLFFDNPPVVTDSLDRLRLQRDRQRMIAAVRDCIQQTGSNAGSPINSPVTQLLQDVKNQKTKLNSGLLEDLEGQVTAALSQTDWYRKWGRHYLLSLTRAHLMEQCNNFKDPGVQEFGGALFITERDDADDLFNNLPAPVPATPPQAVSLQYPPINVRKPNNRSRTLAAPAPRAYAPVSMASYNSRSGPCFRGDNMVLMSTGEQKSVASIVKGDVVASYTGNYPHADSAVGGYKVRCVVKTRCKGNESVFVNIDGLVITPWHPVLAASPDGIDTWRFPADLRATGFRQACDYVYNFVLEQGHIMTINSIACVTQGHSFADNAVIAHPYFGSDQVVQDLANLAGFQRGLVELTEAQVLRDPVSNLISGYGQ
jgi:Mg-chelatase subunit ChlD